MFRPRHVLSGDQRRLSILVILKSLPDFVKQLPPEHKPENDAEDSGAQPYSAVHQGEASSRHGKWNTDTALIRSIPPIEPIPKTPIQIRPSAIEGMVATTASMTAPLPAKP